MRGGWRGWIGAALFCGLMAAIASADGPRSSGPFPNSPPHTIHNAAVRNEPPLKLPPKAEPTPNGTAKSTRSKGTGLPSFGTTLAALAFVVGLILGAGRLLKKHVPTGPRGLPAEALEILGKRRLESRLTIHLVRCGARILVLGASADGLRTLSEISDPVEVDLLAGLCRRNEEQPGVAQSFRSLFRKPSSVPTNPPDDSHSPHASFAATLRREVVHES